MKNGIRLSVRARILSIALIPAATLLAVGVGASTFLAMEAFQLRDEVSNLNTAITPTIEFAQALQEERRFSLLFLSGDRSVRQGLDDARGRVDKVTPSLLAAESTIAEIAPGAMGGADTSAEATLKAFIEVRQGVDAQVVLPEQVLVFYNTVLDRILIGTRAVSNALPDPDAVAGANIAAELADAVELMSRGNALAVATVDTMTSKQLRDYAQQVGSYRSRLNTLTPTLTGDMSDKAAALIASPSWQTLSMMENAIIDRGVPTAESPALPVSVSNWQSAAETVSRDMLGLYNAQYSNVINGAIDDAAETATWWLVAAGGLLVGALIVGMISLRISAGLIRRLKRLRTEALSMADEHLPRIMARLRRGEDVDVTTELQSLDFGADEIGDVAEAFNRAESAAVSAAVEEAKTRSGINALFLNIAHRSQIVVHRQLELLDRAEHSEEDPSRLSVLFELDHLSTRARRNAENLIILGGEQPGRQWRNPVPLVDLLRSAVAETEDYARVHVGHMATLSIVGSVVADLIHLVAELVENATSYSPPESRVDVTSNIVGRGAVVEITDQGLGMSQDQLTHANEVLLEPPAFSVANLSSDSRMGLLVVSRIAARNGVTVKLSESDYGGIRAIVIIPTALIVDEESRRPVAVGAQPGSVAVEENVPAARNGFPVAASVSAVPWPTMEPGEPTPRHAGTRDAGSSLPPAEQGIQPTAGRPTLPRRRRSANLAPELADQAQPPRPQTGGRHERSAERARDLFSEIESGTRQGRTARPEPGRNYPDGQEGLR